MAEYLVYELQEDGTARCSPITLTAENDAAAYVEAARIASPENWVVEVWLGQLLVWHLEPSPGKRPRVLGPYIEGLIAGSGTELCPSAA